MINWWDHVNTFIAGVITALIAIVVGLVRKILTNEAELKILKSQLASFEKDIDEVKGNVKLILEKMID